MNMTIKAGDKVEVSKWVCGKFYSAAGIVEQVTDEYIKVAGDWWKPVNDFENKCTLISVIDPATDKQIAYLIALDWQGNYDTLRKSQASFEIDIIKEDR